jgi:hypothetical protein
MGSHLIKQSARPDMQHRQDGGSGSQVWWIVRQFLGGSGGTAEQESVNHLAMMTKSALMCSLGCPIRSASLKVGWFEVPMRGQPRSRQSH